MRINIVCTDEGWIYSKFVDMFRKYSKHSIELNGSGKFDVNHYIPYYEVPKKPLRPCTAWFSHMETRKDLRNKFVSAAKIVDVAISHSKKYADILKNEFGIKGVRQVIPGVDLDQFNIRKKDREPNEKLIVGYVGRQYTSSNRKNPQLLKQISELPFVEFRTTGGGMKDKDIPSFYEGLDLVISPATIEGGPMCFQESLAVGVPVICFEGVGVADEFAHGLIKVPYGNNKDFLSRLEIIHKTKSYLDWRDAGRMAQMRAQVKDQTWKRFVLLHDYIWDNL